MKIINLDQLKTLILIKGGERNVGRSLPSFIFSHNFVSILFLSHLPHRAVLLTNNWQRENLVDTRTWGGRDNQRSSDTSTYLLPM